MKISILTQHFYPEQFLISQLAVDLKSKGHEVAVLTGLPNYPSGHFFPGYSILRGPYFENYSGILLYRTPIIPRGKGFLQLAFNYMSFILSATLSLFRLPKSDVYFVFAISPLMSALPAIFFRFLTGRPVVVWLQDLWPESLNAVGAFHKTSLIYRLVGKCVRMIYRNSDLILIQSPQFQENLKEYGFPLERAIFTPNWGEELNESPSSPEWLNAFPEHQFVITFAGNVGIAQSIDTIFAAAVILQDQPKIFFAIVGDGRELERMIHRQSQLGLKNIQFYGRKPFSDMSILFRKSSALLVSLKKEEIFQKTIPAKTIQYLAARKPIISCAGGITNEIILSNQAGIAVEPENPKALAAAILELANTTESDRLSMGKNGYNYFLKNHTREIIVNRIESALKKVTKEI